MVSVPVMPSGSMGPGSCGGVGSTGGSGGFGLGGAIIITPICQRPAGGGLENPKAVGDVSLDCGLVGSVGRGSERARVNAAFHQIALEIQERGR